MPKVTNISGVLRVGKIAYDGYGFSKNNWNSLNNGKNSSFSSPVLDTLGYWADTLVIRFTGVNALSSYPKFCKLYIDGSLSYVGKKFCKVGADWIGYTCKSPEECSAKAVFSKRNVGLIYKIKLEFYDEL